MARVRGLVDPAARRGSASGYADPRTGDAEGRRGLPTHAPGAEADRADVRGRGLPRRAAPVAGLGAAPGGGKRRLRRKVSQHSWKHHASSSAAVPGDRREGLHDGPRALEGRGGGGEGPQRPPRMPAAPRLVRLVQGDVHDERRLPELGEGVFLDEQLQRGLLVQRATLVAWMSLISLRCALKFAGLAGPNEDRTFQDG